MRGDFSRSTFEPGQHYTSVRLQQGRMQLDADWNEQMDILLHLLRAQAQDLLGPYGAPAASAGFAIAVTSAGEDQVDLNITAGRYYVDGIGVDNDHDTLLSAQPYGSPAPLPEQIQAGERFVVYLDAWERHLSGLEVPALLEPALRGLDTTTRTQIVWQVRLWPESSRRSGDHSGSPEDLVSAWREWRRQQTSPGLSSRATLQPSVNPAGYDLANQLYRVEIHNAGAETTFKWSRDNGSVAFAVSSLELDVTNGLLTATLENTPADLPVRVGDWLELADAYYELQARPAPLFKVAAVPDRSASSTQLTLSPGFAVDAQQVQEIKSIADRLTAAAPSLGRQVEASWSRTLLRRWDFSEYAPGVSSGQDGALQVHGGQWLPLERGIAVRFENVAALRAGDYWLIPARGESDGYRLLWDAAPASTAAEPPTYAARAARRAEHHLAPLALLAYDGAAWQATDQRMLFTALSAFEAEQATTNRRLQTGIDDLQTDFSSHAAAALAAIDSLRAEMLREVARTPSVVFPVSEPHGVLEPNQVVALNPATGGIELATRDNAALVVGVTIGPVVDRPGESSGGVSYRVAQTGRHECLVIGGVEAGDLLAPSDTPGCAAAAGFYVQPGTVIGKALQDHHPADAQQRAAIAIMVTLR